MLGLPSWGDPNGLGPRRGLKPTLRWRVPLDSFVLFDNRAEQECSGYLCGVMQAV